jgi:hypothetical protein
MGFLRHGRGLFPSQELGEAIRGVAADHVSARILAIRLVQTPAASIEPHATDAGGNGPGRTEATTREQERREAAMAAFAKSWRRSGLADAANAASAAAASTAAASAAAAAASEAASAAPAASTAPAASAASGKSFPKSGRSGVFLVEDVERPQADVGDFFLTESDLGRGDIPRRYIRRRHSGCRRCAARQRQRYAGDTYYRYGFPSRP